MDSDTGHENEFLVDEQNPNMERVWEVALRASQVESVPAVGRVREVALTRRVPEVDRVPEVGRFLEGERNLPLYPFLSNLRQNELSGFRSHWHIQEVAW